MREENEIMDELQVLDGYVPRAHDLSSLMKCCSKIFLKSELKSFPPNAHWFCPRRFDEDHIDYDHPFEAEDDMRPETKLELIQAAKRRHDVAYKYSLIFGLSPDVSGILLENYSRRMTELFTSCDKCVRNWHIGRKSYLKELTEYATSTSPALIL